MLQCIVYTYLTNLYGLLRFAGHPGMGANGTSLHLSLSSRHAAVSHCATWASIPFSGTLYKRNEVKHGRTQVIQCRSIAIREEGNDSGEDGPPLLSPPSRTSRNGSTGRRHTNSLGGKRGKEKGHKAYEPRNSFRRQTRHPKGRVARQSALVIPSTDRWLTNLASQICDMLKDVTPQDPFVDVATAKELLRLLPPPLTSMEKVSAVPNPITITSKPSYKQESEDEDEDDCIDKSSNADADQRALREGKAKEDKNSTNPFEAPPFLSEGTFVNLLNLVAQTMDDPGPALFSLYNVITRSHRMKEARKSYKALAISERVLSTVIDLLGREELEDAALECLYRGLCLDGGDASRRGSWREVWLAFSSYGQPNLVVKLIEKAKSAGVVPGSDAITCLVRAHEINGDAVAAARALKHFGIEGISPPVEALASVGRVAVESGNYSLAEKVISWTNILLAKDTDNNSLVYREMLIKSLSSWASHDMVCYSQLFFGIVSHRAYGLILLDLHN